MYTIKRGAKCHDVLDKVGDCWNRNLRHCLKINGYTQETFAKAYKKQYGTGNQADVYRWLNVGNVSKGSKIGLPSYDTMKRIADFFHVTVGYLTGETDYETFEMERACKYLGITEGTGKSLKRITGSTHDCIEWGYQSDNYQRIIDALFTSEIFSEFVYDLRLLDEVFHLDVDKEVQSYNPLLLSEVNALRNDKEIDYEFDSAAPQLTAQQMETWKRLDDENYEFYKNNQDKTFQLKLTRYELHESFERLIDSLYPR